MNEVADAPEQVAAITDYVDLAAPPSSIPAVTV
jgi:hypothetical protein